MKDELCFNEAARVLCEPELAEAGKSSEESRLELNGYGMHSCVHSRTVHMLNQEEDSALAGLALECVGKHVPQPNAPNFWITHQRLMGHATRCWKFIVDVRLDDNGKEENVYMMAGMYQDLGRHKEAEKMYQWALQGKEGAIGDRRSRMDDD